MNDLPQLLKEWKEDTLVEKDETALLFDEMKQIEERHREMIKLSSDLEEAYYQVLKLPVKK